MNLSPGPYTLSAMVCIDPVRTNTSPAFGIYDEYAMLYITPESQNSVFKIRSHWFSGGGGGGGGGAVKSNSIPFKGIGGTSRPPGTRSNVSEFPMKFGDIAIVTTRHCVRDPWCQTNPPMEVIPGIFDTDTLPTHGVLPRDEVSSSDSITSKVALSEFLALVRVVRGHRARLGAVRTFVVVTALNHECLH